MKTKQGQFSINSLGTVAIILVVAAIIISMGGTILSEIQDTQTDTNGTAYNISTSGMAAMTTLGGWLPTIAIIVAAAIIIGVVVTSFRT